jgi:hypothetical protein
MVGRGMTRREVEKQQDSIEVSAPIYTRERTVPPSRPTSKLSFQDSARWWEAKSMPTRVSEKVFPASSVSCNT